MFLTDRVSVTAPRRTADGDLVADACVARTPGTASPRQHAPALQWFPNQTENYGMADEDRCMGSARCRLATRLARAS